MAAIIKVGKHHASSSHRTKIRFPADWLRIYATSLIPKGTITWVKDELDRVISKAEVAQMSAANLENLLKYSYRSPKGDYVFCWDLTRYVNHSYEPNSMLTALGFEVAIKDILPGEEVTNDYGTLNIIEAFECANGPSQERDCVCPDDLARYYKIWDGQIAEVFGQVTEVLQPLEKFLTAEQTEMIQEIKAGTKSMPSVLENFYRE